MSPKKPLISLSTCCLSHRYDDGYQMLKEIADLGFEYVELSHGIRISLLPGILKALDEKIIKVSSVHNFCPLPPGVMGAAPNIYQPSSSSHKEINLWRIYTNKTLDFAHTVQAKIVVIHSGSLSYLFSNPEKKLLNLAHKLESEDFKTNLRYNKLLQKFLKKTLPNAQKTLDHVLKNLESLSEKLTQFNLTLGIENRDHPLELPFDSLFKDIFSNTQPFAYWHDTGHAHLKEYYGFINHKEHLQSIHHKLIGFHLKDVSKNNQDDQALGSGVLDFNMIKQFIKPEHTLVIEVGRHLKPQEIISSRLFLEKLISS